MIEIKDDMMRLHHICMGGKLQWNPDGAFKSLPNTHIYVYRHKQHESCASVSLSVLQASNWCFERKWEDPDNLQCDHANHHHLLPFFYDNRFLKMHYTKLDELNDIEQKLENVPDFNESEFWHPMSYVNNWDKNDWSKRLLVGIKKTFEIHTVHTAESSSFKNYLRKLKVAENLEKCFIFRGYPDILLQKKSAVVVSGQAAEVADDIHPNPPDSESSNDKDSTSIVENSWQRNPLKGANRDLLEKLGEMLTAQHKICGYFYDTWLKLTTVFVGKMMSH